MAMLPGPNTVVVSWLSATRSRHHGLLAVGGVVLASLIWVAFALWGVGAVLFEAGWLYRLLRLLGAAYLVYIGFRMIRAGLQPKSVEASVAPPRGAYQNPFAVGLMTTLSNPKSAVFWTSAFLVAVPPHAPAWVYAAILAIIAAQSSLWYGGVAMFFSTGFARQQYLRLARRLDMLAGGIMVALGLKLADEVRRELVVRTAS
ncbi:LysE family translocator [Rhizobium puerariae]|uniref:LysE family translocator n=1 Tax=Rhizobium puerariae TaxID=1585791 RepID=A0ABV6AE83_9HYPH